MKSPIMALGCSHSVRVLLSIIVFAFSLIDSSAQFLIKIMNAGNGNYLEVNSSTLAFGAVTPGVGTWDVYQQVDAGGGYYAFKSYANGNYLSVQVDTSVKANATTITDFERFTQTYVSGINFTLLAKRNNAYLTRDPGSNNIYANTFTPDSNAYFGFTQVVDMWVAAGAFYHNHPNKFKLRDSYGVGISTSFDDVNESTLINRWYTILEDYTHNPIGHPCWDKLSLIWMNNWEVLVAMKTLPQYISGNVWTAPIPRCNRYQSASAGETTSNSATTCYYDPGVNCNFSTVYTPFGASGSAPTWGWTTTPYMLNLSNTSSEINMGSRWVIDVYYRDTTEHWTYDLGPSAGTFSPQYGIVAYNNGVAAGSPNSVNVHLDNIQDYDASKVLGPRCPDF
jgi:hypothetical protein